MDFFTKIGDNVNGMFKKKEETTPSIGQKPVVSADPDLTGGRRKKRTKKHLKKRKCSHRKRKGGLLPMLIASKLRSKKSTPSSEEDESPVSGGRRKRTRKHKHRKRKSSRRHRKRKAGDRESESERPTEVSLKPEDLNKYYLERDDEFENDPDYFQPRNAIIADDLGDDYMGEGYIKSEDSDGWNVAHGGKKRRHRRCKRHTKKRSNRRRRKRGGEELSEELSEKELDERIQEAQKKDLTYRQVKDINKKYVGPTSLKDKYLYYTKKSSPKKISFGPVEDLEDPEVQIDTRRNAVTSIDEFMSQGGRRKKRKTRRHRRRH